MKKKFLLIFSILVLISLACSVSGNNNSTDPNPSDIATRVAATLASQGIESTDSSGESSPPADEPSFPTEEPLTPTEIFITPTEDPDLLLSNSLYYISESSPYIFQVYRLERDGITITQITNEPTGLINYTVNPINGTVAYVVNNQIYLIGPDGSGRVMLVDGGPVDEDSNIYIYLENVGGLAWSPDGNILAYGRGGVNFYNFSTGLSELLIPNETFDYPGGDIGPESLYFPAAWSPNGNYLLVEVAWMEGGTFSIYNPSTNTNMLLGYGITCCEYNWNDNSSSILVGSSVLGLIESGLWKFDSATGTETVLLPTTATDGTFNFAGWPKELDNGDLVFFFANLISPPEFSNTPLTMVHTAADGISGLFSIRPETWEIHEALWDSSGESLVVVQPTSGPTGYPRSGPLVYVDTLGNPTVPLVPLGFFLQWGP
jgi:hypothetical protein